MSKYPIFSEGLEDACGIIRMVPMLIAITHMHTHTDRPLVVILSG